MSIQQALQKATQILINNSPSARLDAEVLLCHLLKCNSAHLAAWPEKKLSTEQYQQFDRLLQQRKQGTPVAYITGTREFWSLPFKVNSSTLIPRPETETLVEFILHKFGHHQTMSILDLGTGSGAIAIALANEKPGWQITATDISDDALTLARENAKTLGTNHIEFIKSNWFENLGDTVFDLIVSNPPYVASNDGHLSQGDVRFEPAQALTAGKRGMDDINRITKFANKHLHKGGWLVFEHGFNQKDLCQQCLLNAGFTNIVQKNDTAGQPRMSAGQAPVT